ncbi:MAG: serine dehydratase subunit alpha family protein [Bacteroidales bacterium]|nr:serine dehydratase subunit alpha family protein [Bacteroidales bacterium]
MLSQARKEEILELIKKEVKPALGCTEPIAVSLAVAKACEILREHGSEPENIEVEVSANILKNGMGVGIPGTGMVGLHIAAALALACGKSEYRLEVLKDLTPEAVETAKQLVADKRVRIQLAKTPLKLYILARVNGQGHQAETLIQTNHDSIIYTSYDGTVLMDLRAQNENSNEQPAQQEKETLDYKLNMQTIWDFAAEARMDEIEFILEAETLNHRLAEEGLNGYGLRVGKTLMDNLHSGTFGDGLMVYAMALTAAASDARMAGCTLPAMSNSGSGNQGITVTMPVVATAQKVGADREALARALILAHLTAIHIKGYLGKLSALCGCVIASTGAACGIVRLKGGNFEQACYAIKNMIGNITGMLCDGAKEGCALKVGSGVSSAVQSAVLALENICISESDGIIYRDIEDTIRNLGHIGSKGMENTDAVILDIMICK